jgi:hypothetical protein
MTIAKKTSPTSRGDKVTSASTDLSDLINASEECCQLIFENCSVRIHLRNDEAAKKLKTK